MELIVVPIIISLTHYLGLSLDIHKTKIYPYIKSFSAGISSGYVFLFLLPDLFDSQRISTEDIFIYVLISFTIFHIAHKIIRQRIIDKEESRNIIEVIDAVYISIYSFIATYLILEEVTNDPSKGFILFMVLVIHSLLFDVSDDDFKAKPIVRSINKFIITMGPILAGILFLQEILPILAQEILLAFGIGSLIYISIKEEIPSGKKGHPFSFALGAIILIITVINF